MSEIRKEIHNNRRNLSLQLIGVFFVVLALSAVLQYIKHLLHPDVTLWESHILTNFTFASVATAAAYILARKQNELLNYAVEEIEKRKAAELVQQNLKDQMAIEKAKLEQVLGIEEHLNTIFDIDRLVDFVVQQTTNVLEARKCSVMFVDPSTKELCIKGFQGLENKNVTGQRLKLGDPIAGLVAAGGNPVLVRDIETDRRFHRKNRASYQSKSFVSAPIKLGGQLLGVINVADKTSQEDGGQFSEVDLKILCMIVRQVAVAMENAKLYRELKNLTMTDPLTHIHNYRYFAKTLDHEISRAKRFPRSMCLLMMDLDSFKSYNDTFGHQAGDALLKEVGRAIDRVTRAIDTACRYAGDEFVVILPETDINSAKIVAGKIQEAIESIHLERPVTISIGIAQYAQNMNRHDLIQKADMALLAAKKEGKDRIFANAEPVLSSQEFPPRPSVKKSVIKQ